MILEDIDEIDGNIDEYSLNKKRKLLIVFDNVIADIADFYHAILFCGFKKYLPKFYALPCTAFQTNKSFSKSQLVIHQILIFKT